MLLRRLSTTLLLFVALSATAQPCDHYNPNKQPFFGDLHVHTKYSLDAATQQTRTTPDEAYRFARGEPIGIAPWRDGKAQRQIKIDRPLDFAMIADHAELLGEVSLCSDSTSSHYDAWQCTLYRKWPRGAYYWFNFWSTIFAERVGFCSETTDGEDLDICAEAARGPWQAIKQAAQTHNDAQGCSFTTFVGYEWTGGTADGDYGNIHRNVVFRNANVPELPIDFIQANTAASLFNQLDAACSPPDCEAVVIPHNSNLSAGLMFRDANSSEERAQRARYEVLAEIMQHKGSSECYFDQGNPLNNADEYCAFEQLSVRSFTDSDPPEPQDGFLRHQLTEGLLIEQRTGTNPHQFGFVASTDTHLGAPGLVSEASFPGHGGAGKPASDSNEEPGLVDLLDYNPGGLAVLWAEENSRDALFGAMQKKEAYATSGPRMVVRLFAGEALSTQLCEAPNFAAEGYRQGVPMGGLIEPKEPTETGLRVALQAVKDPLGVGLERLQLVKGWIDKEGNTHEKVVELASSTTSHHLELKTCEVRGRSADKLCGVWEDPEFNPNVSAYYYGRVLEAPTCRWSQRQCVAQGVRCDDRSTITPGFEACCSEQHKGEIRERAWTSPIWVKPARHALNSNRAN